MSDDFTACYSRLLVGAYDCVDRIAIRAYFSLGSSPAGFRCWWRQLYGSDDNLDDTHLMRLAGRFSRRLSAYAQANQIPIVRCDSGVNKHELGEEYLAKNPDVRGLFLVVIARAQAPLWTVKQASTGSLLILRKRPMPYVNHFHFHINDPDWGHITIRMCSHPPFQAMILLNGHEYVAAQLNKAGHRFSKEGNCFTQTQDCTDLALVADALRREDAIGRLSQVCQRWIYSTCLSFALTTQEQHSSDFRYSFSVFQVEYSRNLLFRSPQKMEELVESMLDRSRTRLKLPTVMTILGMKRRPRQQQKRMEVVVEKPAYGLTYFNLHFGQMTLKVYTKGEHTLRFEAVIRDTKELHCGRVLEKFPAIVSRLTEMLERFVNAIRAVDSPFISGRELEAMSAPAQVGKARVGGLDIHKPRTRWVLEAVLALAASPRGFTASEVAATVCRWTGQTGADYGPTRAAYDLRKLRAKQAVDKIGKSRRYQVAPEGLRTIAAALVISEQVVKPLLASVSHPNKPAEPDPATSIDSHYNAMRKELRGLLNHLGIAA